MKNLAFLSVLIMFSSLNGQWEILNEGGSFRTIDFINDQAGWIAGEKNLLNTEDGGETWISINSDWNIRKIDFANENVGWALNDVGNFGSSIIKTVDGGRSWIIQKEFENCVELCVVNDMLIYSVSYNFWHDDSLKIIKSEDGGNTWDDITPQNRNSAIYSIHFEDAQTGILLGRNLLDNPNSGNAIILKTNDGGETWDERIMSELHTMRDLQLLDDSTGYFLAHKSLWKNSLAVTKDTLNSWTIVNDTLPYIDSFYCIDDATIIAVMGNNIIKSIDGGNLWEKIQTGGAGYGKIYFNDNGVGFVLNPHLFRSNDSGRHWRVQKFTYPLSGGHFFDRNKGIVFGGKYSPGGFHADCESEGIIFVTNNGGKSWNINSVSDLNIISRCFLNNNTGFKLSRSCTWDVSIEKTSNGGENWTEIYKKNFWIQGICNEFNVEDMVYMNENDGWIVADGVWEEEPGECVNGAVIFSTTNGGNDWDLIWNYLNTDIYEYSLNSIYVVNTTAWAVGGSGLIVKYTEQDQWQPIIGVTDLPLRDVFFSDEQHGWIAGGYLNEQDFQTILLKTNDGGQTWDEKRLNKYKCLVNDMFFEDSLHGWAVGNDTSNCGLILESWDGGDTWTVHISELSAPLNVLNFKDGYGWAVGDNGLILRYESGASWIDQRTAKTYPTKFSLSQNFPNPFNPSTTIEFTLPKSDYVELKVYNILGKELSTLLSKKLNQGNHKYTFHGNNLASGVYYYRLEAGNFVQIRKMIYLK